MTPSGRRSRPGRRRFGRERRLTCGGCRHGAKRPCAGRRW